MIKNALKTLIPAAVLQWRSRRIAKQNQQKFSGKSAVETFSEIYDENIWGGNSGEFYSGDGSTEIFANQYAAAIKKFIAENDVTGVVDLGCGDFRVAAKFISNEIHYTGVDIVESLIEHNLQEHGNENIDFRRLDIAEDDLPEGDLCLIRQVLQHLSNTEIAKILSNCRKYKFLLVTEHYPPPDRIIVPNIDIPHGPGMRIYYDSAVFLDKPPFDLKNISLLLDVEAEEQTRIKTFVIDSRQGNSNR